MTAQWIKGTYFKTLHLPLRCSYINTREHLARFSNMDPTYPMSRHILTICSINVTLLNKFGVPNYLDTQIHHTSLHGVNNTCFIIWMDDIVYMSWTFCIILMYRCTRRNMSGFITPHGSVTFMLKNYSTIVPSISLIIKLSTMFTYMSAKLVRLILIDFTVIFVFRSVH